jgi:hypothetical protein
MEEAKRLLIRTMIALGISPMLLEALWELYDLYIRQDTLMGVHLIDFGKEGESIDYLLPEEVFEEYAEDLNKELKYGGFTRYGTRSFEELFGEMLEKTREVKEKGHFEKDGIEIALESLEELILKFKTLVDEESEKEDKEFDDNPIST